MLTVIYVLILVLVTIIFDIYCYVDGGWTSTISYLVLARSQSYPILIIVMGVLVGHFLIPSPDPDTRAGRALQWFSVRPLVLLLAGIVLSRLWSQPSPKDYRGDDEA